MGRQLTSASDPITTYLNGYHLRGADSAGACIETGSSLGPFGPRVDYDTKITFQCYKDLTEAELASWCNTASQNSLSIFQQISEMAFIGKFGNSSGLYGGDWVSMTATTVGDPVYDSANKQCTQRVGA